MKSSGIGGQAVLEGIMMKYKSEYSIAVRKPNGEITVSRGKCKSISEKSVFFRLPIIRGVVAFVESLMLGMKSLTYSADFYEEEETENQFPKEEKKNNNKENIETICTVVLAIVLAIGIFMVLPFFLSQLLHSVVDSQTALAAIEGVIRIFLFISYISVISLMKDIKRVFMYHGAEHKSINCIENGLELTVDNVRKQSKHHRRCGTSFLLIVMFISIVCFMFIYFENIWLRIGARILLVPVIAGISYEFIYVAGNTENKVLMILSVPGMLLQRLTTKEPDDQMIEVAIASIEEIFDWKDYQRRLRILKERMEERARKKAAGVPKKSRAEIKEELRARERENKLRATEYMRQLKEMEEKEAELERIAEEARKRKEARKAIPLQTDYKDDNLAGLDHYFDRDVKKDAAAKEANGTKKENEVKIINFSDYSKRK